jgi:hypothetical protein
LRLLTPLRPMYFCLFCMNRITGVCCATPLMTGSLIEAVAS